MKQLRILVVEDDASVSSLLAEMLEELGYSVRGIEATEAGSVKAALDTGPDLMIVDVHLGSGGSGVSVVRYISRITTIPHLLISGDRAKPGQPTANLLQKPFSVRDPNHRSHDRRGNCRAGLTQAQQIFSPDHAWQHRP